MNSCSTKSSSIKAAELEPFPPLPWDLYWFTEMRLIKPLLEMSITISSGLIRSSMFICSTWLGTISVRRSSPYFSARSWISCLITCRMEFGSESNPFRYSIRASISFNSARIFSVSRLVSLPSRISTMAWAWASVNSKRSDKRVFAVSIFLLDLIIATTSSIFPRAITRPRRMCARSSAFLSSNLERRVTTSNLCCTK